MALYLPIAEMTANPFLLIALGASVGFIGGMFGVGGGFLLTPLLIFLGIPPAVAIATQSSQITASSTIGVINAARRNAIDVRFGSVLIIFGTVGSLFGVSLFNQLKQLGILDVAVVFSFITLFTIIGSLMLSESLRSFFTSKRPTPSPTNKNEPWYFSLPLQMNFPASNARISLIPISLLAFLIGAAGAFLGIGGGFILVPALIYVLRVPVPLAVGTATFQILFTMLGTLILHSTTNRSVDAVLAVSLILGTLFGTQFGISLGQVLSAKTFRLLFALLILSVDARFAYDLVKAPDNVYSLSVANVQ